MSNPNDHTQSGALPSVPLQPVVLHPCPFCGAVGHAVAVESFTDQRGVELWIVHCGGCLCDGPMALSPDGAATVWNVRFAIMQNPTVDPRPTGKGEKQ